MLLKWAFWGPTGPRSQMLSCSIESFRRILGTSHEFVVTTPQPTPLRSFLPAYVSLLRCGADDPFFSSTSLWRKWAPWPRLTRWSTELQVDIDVLLLRVPVLLLTLAEDPRAVAVMEEFPQGQQIHGRYAERVGPEYRLINSGLLLQGAAVDLGHLLLAKYHESLQVEPSRRGYFDEQGAVAAAVSEAGSRGDARITILPREDYPVIGDREFLAGLLPPSPTLLHAAGPEHHAFRQVHGECSCFVIP